MGTFSEDIQKIKNQQKLYLSLQKAIKKGVDKLDKELEKYINKRWKEQFGPKVVHFLPATQCGCLAHHWTCKVYFYSVGNYEYCDGAFYDFIPDDEGSFMAFQVEKVKAPIPMPKLRRFLKQMEEETGCKCEMSSSSMIKRKLQCSTL